MISLTNIDLIFTSASTVHINCICHINVLTKKVKISTVLNFNDTVNFMRCATTTFYYIMLKQFKIKQTKKKETWNVSKELYFIFLIRLFLFSSFSFLFYCLNLLLKKKTKVWKINHTENPKQHFEIRYRISFTPGREERGVSWVCIKSYTLNINWVKIIISNVLW